MEKYDNTTHVNKYKNIPLNIYESTPLGAFK